MAIAILAVLTVAMMPVLQSATSLWGQFETRNRLADLSQAITAAYQESVPIAESGVDPSHALKLATGTLWQSAPNGNGWCTGTTAATFAPLSRYLKNSPGAVWRDGYSRPLCLLITPSQSLSYNGATLYYHTLAVVSAGRDGKISPTTMLSDAGDLTLGGDDQAVVINGRQMALAALQTTQAQMQKIVSAYQAYFQNRYLGNSARDASIDYFSNAWGDGSGTMPISAGYPLNVTWANFMTPLGLSASDITDGWGQVMLIDSASDAVRNPGNSNPAMRTPPFTARIVTTLPGGQPYAQTVMGTY